MSNDNMDLIRKHINEEHLCPHCNYSNHCRLSVKRHVMGVHQKLKFHCTLCDYSVQGIAYLRTHLLKIHQIPKSKHAKILKIARANRSAERTVQQSRASGGSGGDDEETEDEDGEKLPPRKRITRKLRSNSDNQKSADDDSSEEQGVDNSRPTAKKTSVEGGSKTGSTTNAAQATVDEDAWKAFYETVKIGGKYAEIVCSAIH